MARIESWFEQDLKKPVIVHKLDSVFSQDAKGNLIGVKVFSDGVAVALTDSITGYCVLADGSTVPVSGSRSGNQASIILPASSYNVPGPIMITVKNTGSDYATTLCAVAGLVVRSRTGNQVSPGSVVTDWTNQISAQLQAVQTAADNLGSVLAVPFSNLTAYSAGNYVMKDGNLYCFTTDHAAGDWNSSQVRSAKLADDVRGLKSALKNDIDSVFEKQTGYDDLIVSPSSGWENEFVNPSTGIINPDYADKETRLTTPMIPIWNYSKIYIKPRTGYRYIVCLYKKDGTFDGAITPWKNAAMEYIALVSDGYIRVMMDKSDKPIDPATDGGGIVVYGFSGLPYDDDKINVLSKLLRTSYAYSITASYGEVNDTTHKKRFLNSGETRYGKRLLSDKFFYKPSEAKIAYTVDTGYMAVIDWYDLVDGEITYKERNPGLTGTGSLSSSATIFCVSLIKTNNNDIPLADISKITVTAYASSEISTSNEYFGKRISILGDSLSTYADNGNPDSAYNELRYAKTGDIYTYPGNQCRYPQTSLSVTNVNQTYWKKVIDSLGMVLGINESWAGSRVTFFGQENNETVTIDGVDYYVSPNSPTRNIASQTRINHLGSNGTPDVILINAGTNDAGNQYEEIGTINYESPQNYTAEQIAALPVTDFADAYRTMLIRIMYTYPNARIICMTPSYRTGSYAIQRLDQFIECMKEICDMFGIPLIDTRHCGISILEATSSGYLPDGVHYNATGMEMVANMLIKGLLYQN